MVLVDDEEGPEPGLNLDNDSLVVTGDQGIPTRGWDGHPTTLTHEEQERIRQHSFGCQHRNTKLTLSGTGSSGGMMSYRCKDCGISIIEGHVTDFEYIVQPLPDEFNNPFLSGKH